MMILLGVLLFGCAALMSFDTALHRVRPGLPWPARLSFAFNCTVGVLVTIGLLRILEGS